MGGYLLKQALTILPFKGWQYGRQCVEGYYSSALEENCTNVLQPQCMTVEVSIDQKQALQRKVCDSPSKMTRCKSHSSQWARSRSRSYTGIELSVIFAKPTWCELPASPHKHLALRYEYNGTTPTSVQVFTVGVLHHVLQKRPTTSQITLGARTQSCIWLLQQRFAFAAPEPTTLVRKQIAPPQIPKNTRQHITSV